MSDDEENSAASPSDADSQIPSEVIASAVESDKEQFNNTAETSAFEYSERKTVESDAERERKKFKNQRYLRDTEGRLWLSEWTACVVTFWLIFVLVILMQYDQYGLSDSVLIALLTTTTVNVIGLPLIVLQGLFPRKGKKSKKNKRQLQQGPG